MKKIILQHVVLLFVSLMLLSSCMGEGRNVESGGTFGVVRFDYEKAGKNVLDVTDDIALYHIFLETAYEGNCYWVVYEIDYDKPENSYESLIANGYLTVDILEKAQIERWTVVPTLTDTSSAITNEVALLSPMLSYSTSSNPEWFYLKGILCITSSLNIPTDQKMYWSLSFDRDNMITISENTQYFDVFLRSSVRSQGSFSKGDVFISNAFDMRDYLKEAANKVKEAGGTLFKLRINYPSLIDENGQLKWSSQATGDIPVSSFDTP